MNVAEILRKCPLGTKLYSPVYGEVVLTKVDYDETYPITCITKRGFYAFFTSDGMFFCDYSDTECMLFPSKAQRDWSKFGVSDQVTDQETERQLKQSEKVLVPNDMKINKKCVPFDIELAKKIMNKEAKGRIVTREGLQVRIVCFDLKGDKWPIVALIQTPGNYEVVKIYESNGRYGRYGNFGEEQNDLLIEVPTYYRDYSNFEPQKWQPCLVRDDDDDIWGVLVCAGRNVVDKVVFYSEGGDTHFWNQFLPLSKVTARLIGTTKSYEELIKELDEEIERK